MFGFKPLLGLEPMAPIRPQLLVSNANHSATETSICMYVCMYVFSCNICYLFQRLLCTEDKILLVVEKDDVVSSWKPGRILLGSAKWGCNLPGSRQGRRGGIYAKITQLYFPTSLRVSVHTAPAGYVIQLFNCASWISLDGIEPRPNIPTGCTATSRYSTL